MRARFPGIALSVAIVLCVILGGCDLAPPSVGERTPTIPSVATATPPVENPELVREPAVGGSFYPDDPEELATMVDSFLEVIEDTDGEPIALIVPHAGYVYSGWVAAYAFKELEGVAYDTIIIVGPNHRHATFQDISVYAQGAFRTPLGLIPIDEEVAQALLGMDERIVFEPDVHAAEHSIEVELPFLQRIYQDLAIVPIVIGQPTEENVEILAKALVEVLRDRKALIIASSDMSHYPPYDEALRVDSATLAAMETMDPQAVLSTIRGSMASGVPNLGTCLCGQGPVLTAMKVAQRLGANQVTVLKYANSADSPLVTGDRSQVVGYGAVMFWRYEPPQLSAAEKDRLLTIARESIAQYLRDGTMPEFTITEANLLRNSGAFVTLKQGDDLRGCVGHVLASQPLHVTVQQAAVGAATEDPRFPPLTPQELEQITIEISVLSPVKRVANTESIEVERHGLVIVAQGRSGILLPQVAIEERWSREGFLEAVSRKAGLSDDAWRQGAALYTFTAIVFGEAS